MSQISWVFRSARTFPAQCVRPLGSFASTSTLAGFATAVQAEIQPVQASASGQEELPGSSSLNAASVGRYYQLDPKLIPEASQAYAGAFYAPREPGHERWGGCKALQQEVAATGRQAIMYRPAMHELCSAVGSDATAHRRLLLTGPRGGGKSIALVGLVEWARQRGWVALYIPSCLALVRGGYFSPRRDAPDRWDTLTSAQQVLKGMLDAHGEVLKRMPLLTEDEATARLNAAEAAQAADAAAAAATAQGGTESAAPAKAAVERDVQAAGSQAAGQQRQGQTYGSGGTLYDMVASGVARDDDAQLTVDAVLQLVRQLAAAAAAPPPGNQKGAPQQGQQQQQQPQQPPVLFALDDYDYLYGLTDYGAHPGLAAAGEGGGSGEAGTGRRRRRTLHADELVLASGMRLLDMGSLGAARVVAATTMTPALPTPQALPLKLPYTELTIPGFSEDETRNALAHYYATRHTSVLATSRQARQLQALTQGNARELRQEASSLGIRLS